MPNALFPTDLIIEHQAEIGLTEEQMLAVSNLVEKLQTEIAAIHEEVSQESEKLKELLAPSMIEEQRALVSIDKLLDLSRREQKSQLLHLIRLKNTLTESQQDRLKEIRSENR